MGSGSEKTGRRVSFFRGGSYFMVGTIFPYGFSADCLLYCGQANIPIGVDKEALCQPSEVVWVRRSAMRPMTQGPGAR